MRNIEIKVRCPDPDVVRRRIQRLGADYQWSRRQTDTYFRAVHGRLKLRQDEGEPGATLIAYRRADESTSRESEYRLLPMPNGAEAREMLGEVLGVLAVVDKRRELYLFGNTRVHLDEVDRLGSFVELETVISNQSNEEARAEHERVRDTLGLNEYEVAPISYSDLILRQR